MKFIFAVLILFAFIPSSWAEITPCDQESFTCNSNNECTCPAGCKYQPAQGEGYVATPAKCIPCDEHHYDDNCTESCSPYGDEWYAHQYYTDTEHPGLVTRGARTKYECYKNVTCERYDSWPDNGTATTETCRVYYRGDLTDSSWRPNGSEHLNKGVVSCAARQYDFDPRTDPDGVPLPPADTHYEYHIDSDFNCRKSSFPCKKLFKSQADSLSTPWKHAPHSGSDPDNDQDQSWCLDASFAEWTKDHLWNISTCGYDSTYNYTNSSWHDGTSTSSDAHVGNNFSDRDVHAPFLENVNNTPVNCYARVNINVPFFKCITPFTDDQTTCLQSSQSGQYKDLSYDMINDMKNYDFSRVNLTKAGNTQSGVIRTFKCIGCPTGRFPLVTTDDLSNTTFREVDPNDSHSFSVCENAAPGYYSKSCSNKPRPTSPSCYWWCGSFFESPNTCNPQRYETLTNGEPCFAGMTSDGGGDETSCKYTAQTQFCDAYGCFSFGTLTQQPSNHTKYNSVNNTTWTFPISYR